MATTLTCKPVFFTQTLRREDMMCLPRLSSCPSKRFFIVLSTMETSRRALCPLLSSQGQDGLVWVLLLRDAKESPDPYCCSVKWDVGLP